MEYWQQFFGSSTANIAFGALLVVIIWLKRRIKISRCKTNCHWFECESQLDNLMKVSTDVQTQRGMIEDIQQMIMELNAPSRQTDIRSVVLRTPSIIRARATSV
jgi:Holliday junction resolvase RusA-like endonuclease